MFVFKDAYRDCRNAFLTAAQAAGADIASYRLPGHDGPDGEGLFIDSALFGASHAPGLLHITSGTHGVEGPAGSNAQTRWITAGGASRLPDNTAVAMVHAVNPWGFAYLSRTNENNVDLNRNFLPFPDIPPTPEVYGDYYNAFRLEALDEASMAKVKRAFGELRERDGMAKFMNVASGGQYTHQDGMNYGGVEEQWQTKTVRSNFDRLAKGRKAVGIIDYHTGFGDYGDHVFLKFDPEGSEALQRTRDWYGADIIDRKTIGSHNEESGDFSQPTYAGLLSMDLVSRAPNPGSCTAVVIEFGTYPLMDLAMHGIRENWVRREGAADTPEGRQVIEDNFRMMSPSDADWQNKVTSLSQSHIENAINGLSAQLYE
ncbi:MAG: DUF2817 domain-containing protein [Pseudomonadota bacterium]